MSIIKKPGLPGSGGCISFEGVEPQWLRIEYPKYPNWIDSIRETKYTMKTFSPGYPYWVAIYRADVGVRYVQMKIAFWPTSKGFRMQLNATGEIKELNISIPVTNNREQWDQIIDKAMGIIMFVGGNNLSNSEFLSKLEKYGVLC